MSGPFKLREEMVRWIAEARRVISEEMNRLGYTTTIANVIDVTKQVVMPGGWRFELPERFADFSEKDVVEKLLGGWLGERGARDEESDDDEDPDAHEALLELLEADSAEGGNEIPASYNFFEAYPACKSAPRNQGDCGSCWAFAATGAAGHRLCKRMSDEGKEVPAGFRLSPQALVSCAPREVSPSLDGCLGGVIETSMAFLAGRETPLERAFPYLSGKDGRSRQNLCSAVAGASPQWGPFGSVS